MYDMLIVDDEPFAVEGICNGRDWKALGIGSVSVAYNADEARRILTEKRIDILICDIEMPDEDGLSLVRWAKEHSGHTESMFLTCHSEFEYAKQAIHLGSFEYLLKPVDSEELEQAVARMIRTVKQKEEQARFNEMYRKYYALWSRRQPLMAERFWQDLLARRILPFGDFLERALEEAGIGLPVEQPALPILISVEAWRKPLGDRDCDIMEYAVKKAAEELWLADRSGYAAVDRNGELFVIVCAPGANPDVFDPGEWIRAGERFIGICEQYFYCQVSCYVGRPTPLQELPSLCDRLKEMERNNVARPKSVLLYDDAQAAAVPRGPEPAGIDVTEWAGCLLSGNRDRAVRLVRQLTAGLQAAPDVHPRLLETYCSDLLQAVHHFLGVKGISVHQIPQFAAWRSAPVRSLAQFENWAVHMVSAVMDAVFEEKEKGGFVRQSIQYMREHVEDNISREDVAAHVGLNPAYLSRLFKKETGKNLVDYLIEAKIERGKLLLDTTDMTVSAIAQQVGYANFSHFTKMFKKQYGITPQSYRQRRSEAP
jgi:two-component system response regulator YesN